VIAVNWRGLYTPKGASDASYKQWTDALRKVGDSPEWKDAMVANGLAPFNMVGGDFQSYVDGVIGEVRAMSVELGVMK
jgi:putative tricarboxylic transport membrane protein